MSINGFFSPYNVVITIKVNEHIVVSDLSVRVEKMRRRGRTFDIISTLNSKVVRHPSDLICYTVWPNPQMHIDLSFITSFFIFLSIKLAWNVHSGLHLSALKCCMYFYFNLYYGMEMILTSIDFFCKQCPILEVQSH